MEDIVFLGDWIKDRVLGSGSFGIVTLWKHKETEEKIAIKMCKWGDELTSKHKERWTNEVEMLQNCSNPNIVGTKPLPQEFISGLEQVNVSKLPILCMEYCSGGDLRQLLNKCESSSGLREIQIRQILSDVGNAMKFLHSSKITHRDLKPENIVMQITNEHSYEIGSQHHNNVIYKLIDLGYAKEIGPHSVCASFVGTLQYLAPEILHSKTYSNSVDYWSFGLLAFEIICGVRPFLPFMAPVQWMPHVKKKASENICVYETYHGDIAYSNEVFPENYISLPFKQLMEKWLRIALEWDPKLRGRNVPLKGVTFDLPSDKINQDLRISNVVLYSMLENILAKKVIKIFCVPLVLELAYEISSSTTISELKALIEKDTKMPLQEQILISLLTYSEIQEGELVEKFWNNQCNIMIFLYNRMYVIAENIEPNVPKAVQRCLEHPRALYNFKNSKELYKCGFYFVMTQKDLYNYFITGLSVRAESLKQEGRQLVLKHNCADKTMEKLLSKLETVQHIVNTGKTHVKLLKENDAGTYFLGGFEEIFKEADEIADKVTKLQSAWSQLTTRLHSAARRSNEILSSDLNNFVIKHNYETIVVDAYKVYTTYRKNERSFRTGEKQCSDIVKICYNCLKTRSKIFIEIQHQPFILKIVDLITEFNKIADIINNASENVNKLTSALTNLAEKQTDRMWTTISLLSNADISLNDLPYSVVSFQKREFKIGESVTTNYAKISKAADVNSDLSSLLQDSMKIKQNWTSLNNKVQQQKNMFKNTLFDFSFLKEN
ncbi:Inhibitor of nuclear factor kappa-B kinase subunit beta [Eumeta japonica]|uniref:IkappaB kinase n=1 Tax=Eumeta variegata TaxID=151549 RepID=A0A4C1WJ02_EUMVA|nr:Inhibitor of nuclear factor kappa-B kinase subunit beta [Eumeta japonica]